MRTRGALAKYTGAPNQLSENWPLFVRHKSGANKTRLSFETVRETRTYYWPKSGP